MGNRRYELTDEQWERIKELIPRSKMGRPRKDDRLILEQFLLRMQIIHFVKPTRNIR